MPKKLYVVRLSATERSNLTALVKTGKAAAYRRTHAQVLLKTDRGEHGPAWTDDEIAEAVEVHRNTVANIRKRFIEDGLEAALNRKKLPPRLRKLDGAQEARLLAVACGSPPKGRARWTLRLLASRLVELEITDTISYETVRQTLKKTRSSHTALSTG